jgi:hypothetical protein
MASSVSSVAASSTAASDILSTLAAQRAAV